MTFRRADVVTVALQGDLGKPRPSIVVQADWVVGPETLLVVLLTSSLVEAPLYRYELEPTAANGLRTRSQAEIDKIVPIPLRRIDSRIGRVDAEQMIEIDRLLAAMVGLAGA